MHIYKLQFNNSLCNSAKRHLIILNLNFRDEKVALPYNILFSHLLFIFRNPTCHCMKQTMKSGRVYYSKTLRSVCSKKDQNLFFFFWNYLNGFCGIENRNTLRSPTKDISLHGFLSWRY